MNLLKTKFERLIQAQVLISSKAIKFLSFIYKNLPITQGHLTGRSGASLVRCRNLSGIVLCPLASSAASEAAEATISAASAAATSSPPPFLTAWTRNPSPLRSKRFNLLRDSGGFSEGKRGTWKEK